MSYDFIAAGGAPQRAGRIPPAPPVGETQRNPEVIRWLMILSIHPRPGHRQITSMAGGVDWGRPALELDS